MYYKSRMEKKKVTVNYIWNLIFQLFLIIVPLIVTPYVSRVLGADGVGKYSFSYSICFYFTLIALLGFNYYAQREIAKCQDDNHKQSVIFWEIMIVRFVSSLIALGAYLVIIFTNVLADYNTLLLILGINIIAIMIDPAFLFQGNEEFKDITIRNVIVKVFVVASIFIFVRGKDDLWIYTLINALSPFLTALALWPFLRKHLRLLNVKELHPLRHVKPTLKLFIPTLAISIYVVLDKTMIGLLVPGEVTVIENGVEVVKKVSDIENGYYEQADKIVKFAMTVVTSLSVVMIPHNSSAVANHDYDALKNNVYRALRFTLLLAIPMTLGLISISINFVPWFFGPGYEKVPYLLMILSPLIIIIGLSGVIGLQYLIPLGKDNLFSISVGGGAFVNFGLNILLIIFIQSYGAAVASVIAELTVLIVQLIFVRKVFSLKLIFKYSYKYIISGIIMFGLLFPVSLLLPNSMKTTLILMITGITIYFVLLLLLKDELFCDTLKKLKLKLLKPTKGD